MKLWGGRFEGKLSKEASLYDDSFAFDRRMYKQDIRGSIAHATMLGAVGVLDKKEADMIVDALKKIEQDIDDGSLSLDGDYEDIHTYIESKLIERIGDAGKKLHTGRSRNDQVALDMKLYTRDMIDDMTRSMTCLLDTILSIMKNHKDTVMPGFTHLQKAQPVTLAHHMGAYFEMFYRDISRLSDCRDRLNECPLGSGALAGTTYPLDREMTSSLLGFDRPTANSMDSVSDRDYLLELMSALSIIAMHLSRLSEEIIIWNTDEYRFVDIADGYATGSSIMPQKKNPDIAELMRGKTGRVYGDLISLLTVMKGIPLAYDKDMQEDKECSFDAMDTILMSISIMNDMIANMTFNKERMARSCEGGYTNATDVADYLVNKDMPFRDAHSISGRLVLYCIENKKTLSELTIEEYRKESELFDDDIYDAICITNCIDRRETIGAPSRKAVDEEIRYCKQRLDDICQKVQID